MRRRTVAPLLLALLAASCSKGQETPPPPAQRARQHLDTAVRLYREIMATKPEFDRLQRELLEAATAKDDARREAIEDAMQKLLRGNQPKQQEFKDAVQGALESCAAGLAIDPDDVGCLDARVMLAEFDETAGGHAKEDLERLLALKPGEPRFIARKAWLARKEGRFAEARRILADHVGPDAHPAVLVEDGVGAFCLNDFETAKARLAAAAPRRDQLELRAAIDFDEYVEAVDKAREDWSREAGLLASEEKADDLPRVRIETSKGPIVLELFENEAPNTVANFVSLAEQGFYDGTRFHAVETGLRVQGGDPNSRNDDPSDDGRGDPGYRIADELPEGRYRHHYRGSVGMVNPSKNANGSQFALLARPAPHWDGRYTVFGRVIEGLEVLDSLKVGDELKSAVVLRKRDHPYRPELHE